MRAAQNRKYENCPECGELAIISTHCAFCSKCTWAVGQQLDSRDVDFLRNLVLNARKRSEEVEA